MNSNNLNDISRLYLEQVASVEEGYKPIDREKESAMYRRAGNLARTSLSSRGKKKEEAQTKSANIVRAITSQKERERFDRIGQSPQHNEALDPVGREDADIDNDGDTDKSDKYLHKRRKVIGKAISLRKEALDPVGREDADIDNDGDTDKSDKYLHNRRKAIGKAIATKKGMKEGFSNWRQDLSEVMTDDIADKPIKEKKINNKIIVNPTLGEAVEQLGGQLIEMFEISGILDQIDDEELEFISDRMIEESVREIFYDCLNEGYEIEEIEEMICESVDTSLTLLTEAEVTYGHDTENPNKEKRSGILQKIKGAVKTIGKGLARGAGYVAGAAVRGAKAVGRETAAGYQRGRQGSSASGSTSSTSSSQESGGDSGEKKPGIISRIGSKLKSGLKKAVASGARAVSRGARNVARRMEGGQTSSSPAKKGQSSEPETSEPEETGRPAKKRKGGPSYAEVKAEIEKREAEKKAKKAKKDDKLDNLLASIRNESVIGDRARNAVADDRLSSEQERTDASMEKLRSQDKRHKKSTSLSRTQAKIAAKKSEDTARAMHPKPGVRGHRIEEVQINEMPYQVMGSTDGKKEKKIGKPVKSRKYADARAAELEDTHKKTGGKYRSQYVEEVQSEGLFGGPIQQNSSGPIAKPKPSPIKSAPSKIQSSPSKIQSGPKITQINSYEPDGEQIDEKILTKKEMSKREEIVKSMKDKIADFEKRYPGRGKEVMYATATKMAKKIAEQNLDENILSNIVDKIKGRKEVGRTGSGGKIYMSTKVKPSNVQYQSTPKPAAAKPAPTGNAAVQAVKADPWTKGAISRDDVMRARADMRAARGTSPKPTSSKPSKGGSSSLSNASSSQSPSGVTGKYQVGGSRGYGISGIKLAD